MTVYLVFIIGYVSEAQVGVDKSVTEQTGNEANKLVSFGRGREVVGVVG